uniref:Uncharacterized protein n=1 Tax=Solanum lycopersicum TaxID=4081 RepID=A0A3Q7H009_SOLLC
MTLIALEMRLSFLLLNENNFLKCVSRFSSTEECSFATPRKDRDPGKETTAQCMPQLEPSISALLSHLQDHHLRYYKMYQH